MSAGQSLIAELEDAIQAGSSEKRVETLRRVTDLFLNGASSFDEEQVAVFDDVIGRLTVEIEDKVRSELAYRLAPIDNAPVQVIRRLAADDAPEVAAPVLAESNRLTEEDLVSIASSKSQQHLLAISSRRTLGERVTDALVEHGDQQVVRTVAKNSGAKFSDGGFSKLVERSNGDEVLTMHVGLRRDIPPRHFMKLVATASDAVQKKLAAANPQAAEAIQKIVSEVAGQTAGAMKAATHDYTAARTIVESLQSAGKLGETEIAAFAKSRKFEETVVAIALLCRLPVEVIERAILDERSDMIMVLTRAAGLNWPTTKAVMLLRASSGGLSEQDAEAARRNFERLQVTTAQRAVRFFTVRQSVAQQPA